MLPGYPALRLPKDRLCDPQQTTPPCTRRQHWLNKLVWAVKGNRAALMRAAGNNDIPVIRRILSGPLDACAVDPNFRYGLKNRTPAMKAAAHGHAEALNTLLDFGANPTDVMKLRYSIRSICFPSAITSSVSFHEPVSCYSPEIIEALLDHHRADPNTRYGIFRWAKTEMTSLEQLNMAGQVCSAQEKAGRLCLLFARNPATNLNTAITFHPRRFFPELRKKTHLEFPSFPQECARINLLGQAFLFNNPALIKFLVSDHRVNPGLPDNAAENLMVTVMDKLRQGKYFEFTPALKAKLLVSDEFREQLLLSTDMKFKRDFLIFLKSDPKTKSFLTFGYNNSGPQELNRLITEAYAQFLPATGEAELNGCPGQKHKS